MPAIPPDNPVSVIVAILAPYRDALSERQRKVYDLLAADYSLLAIGHFLHWREEDVRAIRRTLECFAYRIAYGRLPTTLNPNVAVATFQLPPGFGPGEAAATHPRRDA